MTVEVPIIDGEVAFTQRVELGGAFFGLTFRWNARAELWLLDVLDDDGVDVLLGLALVSGAPINAGTVHITNAPVGLITLFDTEGSGGRPGKDNFASRYRVFFTPYAELEAA